VTIRSHTWSLPDQVCLQRGLAAVRGRVFILYHPVSPQLDRARREAQAYLGLRRHFDSMAILIWVGQAFPPPSAEVRLEFAAAFAAGPRVDAVGWVVDSDRNLHKAMVQSVSTQLFPGCANSRIFRDPLEAATWLASLDGGDAELTLSGLDALDQA
jgi:hypothetical protein